MRLLTIIAVILLVLLGVSFAAINSAQVSINYYIGSKEMALSMLLTIAWIVGGVMGSMVGFWMYLRVKAENLKLKYQIKQQQQELQNLRTLPFVDHK